jgi:phosphohistidine phosphatase
MILIIMRHGEAVDYREPDHTRPLSEYGQQQCENVGKWLGKNLMALSTTASNAVADIDFALVSPYLRTQQSFRALAKHITVRKQITTDSITPTGNPSHNADLIHAYANDVDGPKCMLVVTHMPLVSLLADKVCSGFNAQFFEPANTLVIDYAADTGIGKKLTMFKG